MNRKSIITTSILLLWLPQGFYPGDGKNLSVEETHGNAVPVEIWVSEEGSDRNDGSAAEPLKSLPAALRIARELRRLKDPSIRHGIEILMMEGCYRLEETVIIRPEDSGSEISPTRIRAVDGDKIVISGGTEIKGWTKVKQAPAGLPAVARGKVWAADIPVYAGQQLDFRQLWVNDKKASRAGNLTDGTLDRILSVDKSGEEIWIPAPGVELDPPGQLELVIHQWWAVAILRVKDLEIMGEQARVTFHKPESRIEFEHPWPAPFIDSSNEYNGNSAFYLSNHIGLLNRPGEWFRDAAAGKVFYWPREHEDLTESSVVVPRLETLLRIEGSLDAPVRHIKLYGLGFEHTTWMRPSRAGHVPLQAGMYITDAYKLQSPGTPDKAYLENQAWTGRQPAAVRVSGAQHIALERCRFSHLAATGLDFVSGCQQSCVMVCLIHDIGGTGIQLGFFGDHSFEVHRPYDPADIREICSDIDIANNLVSDCSNEDWGCVGISVGHARDINIEHNEVSHLNYSGICLGWGWTKTIGCSRNNRIHANYIHHFARQMYDVGGIYTLSAQPGMVISANRIEHLENAPYAHMPEHYQYIYLDEGSSFIRVADNWTEKDKFFSNASGPGNEWINNGPGVSEEIKRSAGLEDRYIDLKDLVK